jgi:hypothetical protein
MTPVRQGFSASNCSTGNHRRGLRIQQAELLREIATAQVRKAGGSRSMLELDSGTDTVPKTRE